MVKMTVKMKKIKKNVILLSQYPPIGLIFWGFFAVEGPKLQL